MDIKTFLNAANNLEQTQHNINIGENLLTINYSLIFNKISIRVNYNDKDCFFELRLNQNNDMELDLTEDGSLIKNIPQEIYKLIIDKIFTKEI